MDNNLNFILLNVGYSELNANWNWNKIYSPFARIYFVKEGNAKTRIGGKMYNLKPNHLYLIPPFTLHDDECNSYFSLFYIHFYEKLNRKQSIFDLYDFPIEIEASILDRYLTEKLLEINPNRHLNHYDPQLYDNPPTFSQYIAENKKLPIHSVVETQGILLQLISKFLEYGKPKKTHKDVRVYKCLEYIHKNIDQDITISELADIACITNDHLIRLFKNIMHCTPLKYINLKKIEKAQLLLLTTNMPIKDIAYELSIDNVSYFNKIFKQYTGKTPSEYKRES